MEIGLFGLALSGKTTIFKLLTNAEIEESYKREAVKRTAKIKDKRVDEFAKIYNPKRIVYATLDFIDIPSFDYRGDPKEKSRIFQMIQNVDALLIILRAFNNSAVPWPEGADNPVKQLEILETELIIRDLEIVENRLIRLDNQRKKGKVSFLEEKEEELLNKIKDNLEKGIFVSKMGLSDEEQKLIGSLALFTLKPTVVCVNVDDNQLLTKKYEGKEKVMDECAKQLFAYMELDGKMEVEINELEDEKERELFMNELSIEEPGIERLAKIVYNHVGLISFFTVGEDEVRAWTVKKGVTMKEAAGKIHTDFEKNFIRAEVMKFEDLVKYRSEDKLKEKGLWKLAGKDEIVEDGYILTIRANA